MKKLKPKKLRQYLIAGLILLAVVAGLFAFLSWQSANNTKDRLFISPQSQDFTDGSEVSFDIKINSQTPIDTVTATVSYDKDSLNFKQATYDSSAFGSQIPAITSEGSVTVQVAKLGGETVTGETKVATIIFTGKGSGNTQPTLTDANAAHAGTATNPHFKIVVPLAAIVSAGSAFLLFAVAVYLWLRRNKKLLKGSDK